MLVEFSVRNYRSFKEEQNLSLVASTGRELQVENTIQFESNFSLLKSAVVYGANGAGKSNLIIAIDFMKQFVLNSAQEKPIDYMPFLLDSHTQNQSSEFEMIFINNKVRYQYGFAITSDRVVKEWLIAYPEKRAQHWFEREYNNKTDQEEWRFGSKFLGGRQIDLWRKSTRSDSLFLSIAHQFNSEQLDPIYQWFNELFIQRSGTVYDFPRLLLQDASEKKRILEFINTFDLRINDIRTKKEILDYGELAKQIGDLKWNTAFLIDSLSGKNKNLEIPKLMPRHDTLQKALKNIFFIRLNEKNEEMIFTPEMESDGTLKIFMLTPILLRILQQGKVFIVDEIDNSLHPLLVRGLLKYFQNIRDNQSNAQMICTTHDTNLLDPELLRRDQIWFTEKKIDSSTDLYSLADYSPRKNEAFGKGYLEGRYGALPFIGDWKFDV